ncbi:MAG: M23 family peptidase, partial [Erythrobacter sp.]
MSDRFSARKWGEQLRLWFPDREFFMRADGQVRFIKISSKLQIRAAAAVLGVALVWLVSLAVMAWGQYRAEADLASFVEEKARVATSSERIKAYGDDLQKQVAEMKQRQDFLEEMARMLPEDIVAEGAASGTVTDSS